VVYPKGQGALVIFCSSFLGGNIMGNAGEGQTRAGNWMRQLELNISGGINCPTPMPTFYLATPQFIG
jgi:hypothetical protein